MIDLISNMTSSDNLIHPMVQATEPSTFEGWMLNIYEQLFITRYSRDNFNPPDFMKDILDDSFAFGIRYSLFLGNLLLLVGPMFEGREIYWGALIFTAWGIFFTTGSMYFSLYAHKDIKTFNYKALAEIFG